MADELVVRAAEVLEPFVVGGAGAVATGAAEQVGADLYHYALRLLQKLHLPRRKKDGKSASREELVAALRNALSDQAIRVDDLKDLLALHAASPKLQGNVNSVSGHAKADTVIQGSSIVVENGNLHIGRRDR